GTRGSFWRSNGRCPWGARNSASRWSLHPWASTGSKAGSPRGCTRCTGSPPAGGGGGGRAGGGRAAGGGEVGATRGGARYEAVDGGARRGAVGPAGEPRGSGLVVGRPRRIEGV